MMRRIVSKEQLQSKIDELLKEFEIIGPKDLSNKGIFYQSLSNVEDLYLGDGFAVEPMKKFFLEPFSWILKYKQADGMKVEAVEQPDKKRIVIGARPCEARGLTLLDNVFGDDYKDSFYITNRQKTTIIGLACDKPDRHCFCTSMNGSPTDTAGMDALLFKTDKGFAVDIITDKGKEIFGSLGAELSDSEIKSFDSEREKQKESVRRKIRVPDSLDSVFKDEYWTEVSKSCINCGICTYLCPTCHCFDLIDEERKRLRCYDGCSFPDFTQEASGENPRPAKRERYRQRVFHKFDYFKKNFGENLCVGCGRCIRFCPVKMDIAEIVDKAPVVKG